MEIKKKKFYELSKKYVFKAIEEATNDVLQKMIQKIKEEKKKFGSCWRWFMDEEEILQLIGSYTLTNFETGEILVQSILEKNRYHLKTWRW